MNDFPSLDGLRILLVDDNIDTLELVAVILSQYGTEVITAASVAEALEALAQFVPDILISDIAMPGEDGYSLIRQVRALEAFQGEVLPAIALTAYVGEAERVQALEAGFQMHVSKPVDPFEFVAVVASLAARRLANLNTENTA
jgi:CheY-like chemotaxis protein